MLDEHDMKDQSEKVSPSPAREQHSFLENTGLELNNSQRRGRTRIIPAGARCEKGLEKGI